MPEAEQQRPYQQGSDQDPQLYARSFADVYNEWYGDLDDPATMVSAFAERLRPGATILELGSGTGRLSAPLALAGFTVVALDASLTMLLQDAHRGNRIAADMQAPPLRDDSMAGVLIAYNTFFNLAASDAQRQCLNEVRRVLEPGGLLAIDVFASPADRRDDFGMTVRQHPTRDDARLAILTGPDEADPTVIVGSHVELGGVTTCRPWRLSYRSARELDELASENGLHLVERCDDWTHTPHTSDSLRHVSWYRRSD